MPSSTYFSAIRVLVFACLLTGWHQGVAQSQWSQQIGGPGTGTVAGMAVDASSNVYCVGSFATTVQSPFGTLIMRGKFSALPGYGDGFLAKYSSQGQPLWVQQVGQADRMVYSDAMALDPNGNVFWLGRFDGGPTLTIGSVTLLSNNNNFGGSFLAKYSAQGVLLWARILNNGNSTYSKMCTDNAGSVYVGGPAAGVRGNQPSLMKLDAQGNFAWSTSLNFNNQQLIGPNYCTSIAVDNNNQLWVGAHAFQMTGHTSSSFIKTLSKYNTAQGALLASRSTANSSTSIFFDTNGIAYTVEDDMRITSYDATQMSVLWSQVILRQGYNRTFQGVVGPNGNLYLASGFQGNITVAGTTFTATGTGNNGIIIALNSQGTPLGAVHTGSSLSTTLALGSQQEMYLAGQCEGTSTWAGVMLTSRGPMDAFVTRLGAVPLTARGNAPATGLTAYPNPTTQAAGLHIALSTALAGSAIKLRLSNLLGQVMSEKVVPVGTAATTFITTGLAPGTYVLQAHSTTGVATQRVVLE